MPEGLVESAVAPETSVPDLHWLGLQQILVDLNIDAAITRMQPCAVQTRYYVELAERTKASRMIALADDIASFIGAAAVRITIPPGSRLGHIDCQMRSMIHPDIAGTEMLAGGLGSA